jgi:hypothetical protein
MDKRGCCLDAEEACVAPKKETPNKVVAEAAALKGPCSYSISLKLR